jgi:Fe2+ transport protein
MPTTTHAAPPRDITDEASRRGLDLAREAGDAYRRMVEYFITEVATSGALREADDYLVGVAVEEAEPLWHLLGGTLQLKAPPADANAHLEVVVMDRADHRFIPGLTIGVVLSRLGHEIGTYHLPMLWHPTMFHYGRSIHVPADGDYRMAVSIEAPTFGRHDKTNGERYASGVTVAFEPVRIERGRKT